MFITNRYYNGYFFWHEIQKNYRVVKGNYLYKKLQVLTNITNAKSNSPKDIARQLVIIAGGEEAELTDLQRFDKHIDAIVYAVGGAYKLGLTPQQLEAGIAAVMHSNTKKIGAGKDEHGKALKPDNWSEIEAEQTRKLQAILDKRA